MKPRPYFPLLAKVLGWLLLHLIILALAFVAFVGWQLRLGLDSLLSGAAGVRLRTFGEGVRDDIVSLRKEDWNAVVENLAKQKNLEAAIYDYGDPKSFPFLIPSNIQQRIQTLVPPPPMGPLARRGRPPEEWAGPPDDGGPPSQGRGGPRFDDFSEGRPPFEDRPSPVNGPIKPNLKPNMPNSHPVFLLRGDGGEGYWAGVQLSLPGPHGNPARQHLLLVRAASLDGSGMFFDFKPWLLGGLAVLALSLAFWAPFVWRITAYLQRLTSATGRIAAGDFKISLPHRGNDELGNLGNAIESMATRLDRLISGQKRFLGDAAHELCAPLARLRTGLGILEMKLGKSDQTALASVESDAQELATLIEEILAFSRAGNREPHLQALHLEPLIQEVLAREARGITCDVMMPRELVAIADRSLLGRALGNLIRNANVHAGPHAKVTITAAESGDHVAITISDSGPGVAQEELARLFEPFYRPDRSRSRDTGGNGLGLAIVRTAIEACGGETTAAAPETGGFSVTIRLRKCLHVVEG